MSENIQPNNSPTDPSYNEASMQITEQDLSQDSPMSPPSSDEEDEELEEELMYYQIAMEAKAEMERLKSKVNDEFIFKKPLHPAPRAKNRSNIPKKCAFNINSSMIPLFPKKILKKRRYYYIETKYTPLPPLVPINQEALTPQPSKTYLFDPSKMPRLASKPKTSSFSRVTTTTIWFPPRFSHFQEDTKSGRRNPVGYHLLQLEATGRNMKKIKTCIKIPVITRKHYFLNPFCRK